MLTAHLQYYENGKKCEKKTEDSATDVAGCGTQVFAVIINYVDEPEKDWVSSFFLAICFIFVLYLDL